MSLYMTVTAEPLHVQPMLTGITLVVMRLDALADSALFALIRPSNLAGMGRVSYGRPRMELLGGVVGAPSCVLRTLSVPLQRCARFLGRPISLGRLQSLLRRVVLRNSPLPSGSSLLLRVVLGLPCHDDKYSRGTQ